MSDTENEFRARLPSAAYDLAMRLGVKPENDLRSISLTQSGRMKRSLDSSGWMAFTADQNIRTHACEFDWRAKAGPFGLISGRDALIGGQGQFDIMALGIVPLARAKHTPALVRGELMRYLAEIAWAPAAILLNRSLRWRADGPDTLAVGASAGDTAAEVLLSLDSDGRIASGFAPDRPRSATAPTLPTPWRGSFSNYRLHADIWLPFAGEVAWEIDGKKVPYWECRIETWTAILAAN